MKKKNLKIGVLDIQGSVEEHTRLLERLGICAIPIKTVRELKLIDGLIIPGGESTTIGKLMNLYKISKEIARRASAKKNPMAVWGTCAGAILLAGKGGRSRHNLTESVTHPLNLIDIEMKRNAYGSQLNSFETEININLGTGDKKIHAIFIRAPQVKKASASVKILAKYDGKPVMLRQKNILVTTFHPELTSDTSVHEYFLSLTQKYAKSTSKK